jgi:tripartite-type tricarboxylate transporter receptor subunit TctC
MPKPHVFTLSILIVAGVAGADGLAAQAYPNKYIRLLAAEAGGGNDLVARLIAQGISQPLGQQIIVENRPARVVGELAAKATNDGYTLLMASSTFLFAPLFEETKYDATKDFSPISMVATAPNILVVHPTVPVKSVQELIALAKSKPGTLNYGTGGTGSSLHLAAELFKQMAGVDIVRINYKGTGPAVNDLLGGQVQMVFATAQAVMQHVGSGRLRALAVTSPQPSALAPRLPTVAASGLPGYEMEALYAILAPAGAPATVIRKLNEVVVHYLTQANVKERLLNIGIESAPGSPRELSERMKSELAKIAELVKTAGMRAY